MFGLLAYTGTAAGATTYQDLTAAADADFSQRNSHYILSEPYDLLQAFYVGDDITNGRLQIPTLNAVGEFSLWPPNASATNTIRSNPLVQWFGDTRPELPQNEEIQAQVTCTAAMAQGQVALWIGTKDWNANVPKGRLVIPVRATASVANTAYTWNGPGAITLAQSLRGGVYAVLSAAVFCANSLFFRLNFPRTKQYRGRKLKPGYLCMNALADLEAPNVVVDRYYLGVWGYFHTFELPQIEIFGNTAAAATQEIRLWLAYLGEDVSILNQLVSPGY